MKVKKKSKLQKKKDNPNSRFWKLRSDKLIRLIALKNSKICSICSTDQFVQYHHLHPREMCSHRHLIQNGILLCAVHHRFSFVLSAHKAPIAFAKWMIENRKEQWEWLLQQEPTRHNIKTFKETAEELEIQLNELNKNSQNNSSSLNA